MEDSGIDSGDHNGDPTFKPAGSDSSSAGSSRSPPRSSTGSTSRQLQRKLEARIEHAKRLHQEYNATPGLIPIQRLPIPGAKDHQPLVQWDTDDRWYRKQLLCWPCATNTIELHPYHQRLSFHSVSCSRHRPVLSLLGLIICHSNMFYPYKLYYWSNIKLGEEDIVNFFPLSRKESRVHHELTDTFSIEEMSISGDDDEEEDLHLVPPQTVYKRFDCCSLSCCLIM